MSQPRLLTLMCPNRCHQSPMNYIQNLFICKLIICITKWCICKVEKCTIKEDIEVNATSQASRERAVSIGHTYLDA